MKNKWLLVFLTEDNGHSAVHTHIFNSKSVAEAKADEYKDYYYGELTSFIIEPVAVEVEFYTCTG